MTPCGWKRLQEEAFDEILRLQTDVSGDRVDVLAEAERAARASSAIPRMRLDNDHDETSWALHALSIVLVTENRGRS